MEAIDPTLHKKLIAVQQDLKAPKGQWNDFSKFHYRSCEDILEAVKPLLHAAGLLLTLTDRVEETGGRIHVVSTATVSCPSGSISREGCACEPEKKKGMDSSQITGTASSYARKCALNGLFLIDDNKDADTVGAVELSEDQTNKIRKLIKDTDTDEIVFCKAMNFDSIEAIPAADYNRCVEALNAKAKAMAAKR